MATYSHNISYLPQTLVFERDAKNPIFHLPKTPFKTQAVVEGFGSFGMVVFRDVAEFLKIGFEASQRASAQSKITCNKTIQVHTR